MLTKRAEFLPSIATRRILGIRFAETVAPVTVAEKSDAEKKLAEELEATKVALAECENSRRAAISGVAEIREFGHAPLARDLVEVVDNVERAAGTSQDRTTSDGLWIMAADFVDRLARHGVRRIKVTKGDRFDPSVHHAIAEVARLAVDGAPPDFIQISSVVKSGWLINGRLLRPALVSVFKK